MRSFLGSGLAPLLTCSLTRMKHLALEARDVLLWPRATLAREAGADRTTFMPFISEFAASSASITTFSMGASGPVRRVSETVLKGLKGERGLGWRYF